MADLLIWNDKYTVGIKRIDDNHKKIINFINTLLDHSYEARSDLNKKALIILLEVNDHLNNNFYIEEKYISNDPKAKEHNNEHIKFAKKSSELLNNFFCRNQDVQIELKLFLIDYFITHILDKDKKDFAGVVTN